MIPLQTNSYFPKWSKSFFALAEIYFKKKNSFYVENWRLFLEGRSGNLLFF